MEIKQRGLLLMVVLTSVTTGCVSGVSRSTTVKGQQELASKPSSTNSTALSAIDPIKYTDVRSKIDAARTELSSRYQHTEDFDQKLNVINDAREYLTQTVYNEIFPHWYGTGWDFNGTTETPRQGKIACGYFVSTVLRDAGLKVQRARMAQQASENIVLSLTSDAHIKRFRNVNITDFVKAVQNWGPGLYVVGLDIHTGFILNVDGDVYFIHSSYIDPYAVVKERALESRVLSGSKYRILGKLSADDQLIMKWLNGEAIATHVG
jgi:hypothetical protein